MVLTREQLEENFRLFDKSGDGKLTYEEFKEYLSKLLNMEVSDMAVRNVFDSVNKSGGDEYITLEEWLDSLDRKSLKDVGKEDLVKVFRDADANGNGKISLCELKTLLKSLKCTYSDDEITEFFNRVDTSDDGAIGYEEFSDQFFNEV